MGRLWAIIGKVSPPWYVTLPHMKSPLAESRPSNNTSPSNEATVIWMASPLTLTSRNTTGAVLTGANEPPYSVPTKPIDISPKLATPRGTIRKSQWPWRFAGSARAAAGPASQVIATGDAVCAAQGNSIMAYPAKASIINRFTVVSARIRWAAGGPWPGWSPWKAVSTSRSFANSFSFFANGSVMQFARRQRLFEGSLKPLLVSIPVGLLLGFAGPFGSYPVFPAPTRYAFWLGLTVAGVAIALAADAILPAARRRSNALRAAAQALLSSVPMTFVVAWTMSFIQTGRTYTPSQLFALFWGVAAVQLLIVFVISLAKPKNAHEGSLNQELSVSASTTQLKTLAFPPALLGKLPPNIGRDIIALETEDHYLRVHTGGGNGLILMRMADAVALLDPQLGAQVHRRWWVSQSCVKGVHTDRQKTFIILQSDMRVPVGRTFVPGVKQRFAAHLAHKSGSGTSPA